MFTAFSVAMYVFNTKDAVMTTDSDTLLGVLLPAEAPFPHLLTHLQSRTHWMRCTTYSPALRTWLV
jgi:hypothetical protein